MPRPKNFTDVGCPVHVYPTRNHENETTQKNCDLRRGANSPQTLQFILNLKMSTKSRAKRTENKSQERSALGSVFERRDVRVVFPILVFLLALYRSWPHANVLPHNDYINHVDHYHNDHNRTNNYNHHNDDHND